MMLIKIQQHKRMNITGKDPYRPPELDDVTVTYVDGKRVVTCFCGDKVSYSIVPHLKKKHESQWQDWKATFVKLNGLGYSLKQIMRLFSAANGSLLFSWTVVERAIKEEVESGRLPYSPPPTKAVKRWQPTSFSLQKTTVWDFPSRGNWAVHSSHYRGNWPPQIPRNLIERYTNKGELVVDAFAGGGTTLIEAWLLGRRSVGLDISKLAIQTANTKLNEMENLANEDKRIELDLNLRPLVVEANAIELSSVLLRQGIEMNNVKLLCAHPPYLDSIRYTTDNPYDLALVPNLEAYCSKMRTFALQVRAVLSADGVCAILIGDIRKKREIIPLGLRTLYVFLSEGLKLDNIVVKTQHKDSSSEFWIRHKSDILLIAHEYLFIFANRK